VIDRPERRRRHAERQQRRGMTVDNGVHVCARLVRFAVDESLAVVPLARLERFAFEIERAQIVERDEPRRDVARHEEAFRVFGIADADVAKSVDDTLRE